MKVWLTIDGLCTQIDLPPYENYASLERNLTLLVEGTVGTGYVLQRGLRPVVLPHSHHHRHG